MKNLSKQYKVAWIPSRDNHLTAAGVKAIGGYFIKGDYIHSHAVTIALDLSHGTNIANGHYIPVCNSQGKVTP